jgi:hypothetical protein
VNSTGAVGAFKVQNLGGKDILFDKISVRGVEESWSDVYYFRVPSGTSIEADLNRTDYTNLSGVSCTIDGETYNQSIADLPLISGGEIFVYVSGPDNVQMDDIGTTVSISISTANAQYITECNVESGTDQ